MPSDRVLVIGATRGTGLLIARRLTQAGVAVRALARDSARATQALGRGVEVVAGDITRPETLPSAIENVSHIVFTAGRRSNRPAREESVRDTEYQGVVNTCLLYTSDAADERSSVDLGGRRIIKKKKKRRQ